MSMKERIDGFRKRLKLDSHHTTERFGVIVAVLSLSLVAILAGTAGSAISNNIQTVSETALYTPTFTTSKTGLSGQVDGVYVSEDRTRALVLMKFSGSSSTSSISADAKNYQAFLTGTDQSLGQQQLQTNVTGQIVVFGTSGYMGVVLDSDQPFAQQIMSLTIRSNSELVYKSGDTNSVRADLKDDDSFQKYDQWRIFLNPGASKATETNALGDAGGTFTSSEAYYSLVVKSQEEQARAALDDSLAKMQVDLANIDEYTAQMATTQVGGVSIVPPTVPEQIAGDTITGVAMDDDADGSDPLTLHSKWTAPNGYDFDWRNGSVQTGYLHDLVPEGESYVSFLEAKAKAKAGSTTTGGSSSGSSSSFNVNALPWLLSDGSDLTKYSSSETMQPLVNIMNNLTQAYQTYYTDKVAYQTTGYNTLISLEISLMNVDNSSTVNDSEKALFVY